jgi:hypothetical protein
MSNHDLRYRMTLYFSEYVKLKIIIFRQSLDLLMCAFVRMFISIGVVKHDPLSNTQTPIFPLSTSPFLFLYLFTSI